MKDNSALRCHEQLINQPDERITDRTEENQELFSPLHAQLSN